LPTIRSQISPLVLASPQPEINALARPVQDTLFPNWLIAFKSIHTGRAEGLRQRMYHFYQFQPHQVFAALSQAQQR